MSTVQNYMKKYLQEGLEKIAFEAEDAAHIAEYFATELEKEAGLFDAIPAAVSKGALETLGKVGAGAALGIGLLGAQRVANGAIDQPIQKARFMRAVEQAIAKNQVLQHADKARVMNQALTIFKYAPNAAADANLLSSILSQAVMMDGVDQNVIQSLLNLEKTYREANRTSLTDFVLK